MYQPQMSTKTCRTIKVQVTLAVYSIRYVNFANSLLAPFGHLEIQFGTVAFVNNFSLLKLVWFAPFLRVFQMGITCFRRCVFVTADVKALNDTGGVSRKGSPLEMGRNKKGPKEPSRSVSHRPLQHPISERFQLGVGAIVSVSVCGSVRWNAVELFSLPRPRLPTR